MAYKSDSMMMLVGLVVVGFAAWYLFMRGSGSGPSTDPYAVCISKCGPHSSKCRAKCDPLTSTSDVAHPSVPGTLRTPKAGPVNTGLLGAERPIGRGLTNAGYDMGVGPLAPQRARAMLPPGMLGPQKKAVDGAKKVPLGKLPREAMRSSFAPSKIGAMEVQRELASRRLIGPNVILDDPMRGTTQDVRGTPASLRPAMSANHRGEKEIGFAGGMGLHDLGVYAPSSSDAGVKPFNKRRSGRRGRGY